MPRDPSMRPALQVRGTGGVADMIAQCRKDPHTFFPDEKLMEVVADGNIEARLGRPTGRFRRIPLPRSLAWPPADNPKPTNPNVR